VQWHELRTTGQDAALAFYAAQFRWTKGDAHDMGPMGIYQMIKAGETEIGAIQSIAPPKPSSWLYYFGVESVSSAAAAIAAAGGAVVNGPMPVPGGAHILHGTDPQGALFALVGPA
jgi:predicted enzyme related to lactoylglutathione lyase